MQDTTDLFVLTLTADQYQRRLVLAVLIISAAIFVVFAPFAHLQLVPVWAFIPIYQSAIITNDVVTAGLLFGQFAIVRSNALLALSGGYVFSGLMAAVHMLTFPGLFSPSGLLGAGEQTTAWLYMFWHGGFPLAALAYALWERTTGIQPWHCRGPAAMISLCIVGALLAAGAVTLIATAGHDLLPQIMHGNQQSAQITGVVTTVWMLNLVALAALWRRQPRSLLDLWVMAVLVAWLFDIALSAVLDHGRFDVGFYAGRTYGLLASSVVLFALLFENSRLYARTAQALEGERRERRLVLEKTAELNAANEQLEQRVAARTVALREISALSASAREADMDLECLLDRVPQDDAELAHKIAAMLRLLGEAMASTRRIASDLRPLMLDDLGFAAAIQWLLKNFGERHGIACTLHVEPPDLDLRDPHATAVFRIVQESLANVARHACASHVEVILDCKNHHLSLVVRDDGVGFDPASPRKSTSFGLVGLRERAYLLDGTLSIDAAPGKGTAIKIDIPMIAPLPSQAASQPGPKNAADSGTPVDGLPAT
ncbi:sensor histidine kinase [Paraburkholderia ferrariae]|uniref:sensor histidine kinase n=1 Tax=Paraburkholderia ferrariae TaxID=386056 RepID=UPI0005A8844D|nr:sensor histidine kinase [Paraburkholderia ferrariae]